MSITLYSGVPGSSKSLHAAGDIRMALTKPRGEDRPVIANFPCNVENLPRARAFHYVPNEDLTPSYLCDFADEFWALTSRPFSEDYILVVIDECQILFNSRNWHDRGRTGRADSRMDWLEFLSQHRKYGIKIILIAQNSKMIDNQFRMLLDDEYNHRSIRNMGKFGGLLDIITRHRLFLRVHYLYQAKERLGMQLCFGRQRDMDMYDSYARLKKVDR